MRLVASGLSTPAYVTVATIIGLENVLDRTEGFVTRFDRERGRDPGLYYLRVFGRPGGRGPWGWRFGGHHVSLNNLVVDGAVVATTPCFLGADPATSPLLGGAVNRPLARVEDLARDLVRSLPPELAARAVLLSRAPSDLVTANRTTVAGGDRVIPLTGIWRDERFPDPAEQAKLQALSDAIDEAAGFGAADHAAVAYTAEPKGVSGPNWTPRSGRCCARCWAPTWTASPPGCPRCAATTTTPPSTPSTSPGPAPPTPGEPHYYRLQGPRLLVEWDNTQRGANHAHSVWRDPERRLRPRRARRAPRGPARLTRPGVEPRCRERRLGHHGATPAAGSSDEGTSGLAVVALVVGIAGLLAGIAGLDCSASAARTSRKRTANGPGSPVWPYSPPRNPPWPPGNATGVVPSRSATACAPRWASSPSDSAPAARTMRVDAARSASKSGS